MPSPVTVRSLLREAINDKTLSAVEANEIDALLKAAKPVAGLDPRAVVRALASNDLTIAEPERDKLREDLLRDGYNYPKVVPPGLTPTQLVTRVLRSNITELDPVFARIAKATGRTHQTVIGAVLDGGTDLSHVAFENKRTFNLVEQNGLPGVDDDKNGKVDDVDSAWNFVDGNNIVKGGTHGTHCFGEMTAGTHQIKGAASRVYTPISAQAIADGIDYEVSQGARVVSMSFKINTVEQVEMVKAAILRHPDVLFCKSAGNDGNKIDGGVYKPESYLPYNQLPNLAVIVAADPDGKRASYSNYDAPFATHAAIGTDVYSAVDDGKYESMDGTSMATPTFANLALKCLLEDDKLTPEMVLGIIADTSNKTPAWADVCVSGGLVNEERALLVAGLAGEALRKKKMELAADELKLSGPERTELIAIARKYVHPKRIRPDEMR